mgnify:CR=1 FL=1
MSILWRWTDWSKKDRSKCKADKALCLLKYHWHFEHDMCELRDDGICSYRIFANQFLRWNKKAIGENEVRTVLQDEQVKVRLCSSTAKKEYFKWAVLDKEYGLSIVWDIDINEEIV